MCTDRVRAGSGEFGFRSSDIRIFQVVYVAPDSDGNISDIPNFLGEFRPGLVGSCWVLPAKRITFVTVWTVDYDFSPRKSSCNWIYNCQRNLINLFVTSDVVIVQFAKKYAHIDNKKTNTWCVRK